MKSYFLLLLSCLLITFACQKINETPDTSTDYPSIIDEYITLNYPGFTTYNVELEAEREYEVTLCDGNILVFDLSGIFMRERTGGEAHGDPNNCPDTLFAKIDLALTMRVKDNTGNNVSSMKVGEEFNYEIIVANGGPANATGVRITTSILSNALEYISSDGFYDENSGVWKVGDILAGSSQKLTVKVKSKKTGGYTYEAEVKYARQKDSDSQHGNNIPEEDDQDQIEIVITE